MFKDDTKQLEDYLDHNQSLRIETICLVELNQNDQTNITNLGVYKTDNPTAVLDTWVDDNNPGEKNYKPWPLLTTQMRKTITEDELIHFVNRPKEEFFSLADCFSDFRPRSGILKLVQPYTTSSVYIDDFKSVNRPRYYVPSIKDEFKYWTSWRSEPVTPDSNILKHIGLSENKPLAQGGGFKIDNAAPFVKYGIPVPANKVTVKIQTGIGKHIMNSILSSDPLSDLTKSTLPKSWKIQYLYANTWKDLYVFSTYDREILDPTSGLIDFVYAIDNKEALSDFPNLHYMGHAKTIAHLPVKPTIGDSYCVGSTSKHRGNLWVANGEVWHDYGTFRREWIPVIENFNPTLFAIDNFINPPYFNPSTKPDASGRSYNEFDDFVMMEGIRIVVNTMVAPNKPFELIELSPRLIVNISSHVESYTIDRAISEDHVLPIGEMSVSNGTVDISNIAMIMSKELEFDYTDAEGESLGFANSTHSLLAGRINKSTKFIFSELVRAVDLPPQGLNFNIPSKTLYSMSTPTTFSGRETASIELRDLTFLLEERQCPNIVLKQCSLSKAVAVLLDSIGYTNYIFRFHDTPESTAKVSEPIIPYFFTNQDMNIAEALQALSIATQCAMFFDEYNNFVVMPRSHFNDEPIYILRGDTLTVDRNGNALKNPDYANIESISNATVDIVADIEVNFTQRELAREEMQNFAATENSTVTPGEAGSLLGYKVSSLWDSTSLENQALAAVPLNGYVSGNIPKVKDRYTNATDMFQDYTIDVGLWASQLINFDGLLMINSEIIRYDAKEYSIYGTLYWVTSRSHLEELRGSVGLTQTANNDQIGVPTGRLRIWTELGEDSNGVTQVIQNGRGVYGTKISAHDVGATDWLKLPADYHEDTAVDTKANVKGFVEYTTATLFTDYKTSTDRLAKYRFARAPMPIDLTTAKYSKISNFIYNPLHSSYSPLSLNPANIPAEYAKNPTMLNDKRIMRSSAITMSGPVNALQQGITKRIMTLPGRHYSVFGTRIGIVGINSINDSGGISGQSPIGSAKLGTYAEWDLELQYKASKDSKFIPSNYHTPRGAGGGLCFWTNRRSGSAAGNNDGYYFEISALADDFTEEPSTEVGSDEEIIKGTSGEDVTDTSTTGGNAMIRNINFYKINTARENGTGPWKNVAVPLYSSYFNVTTTTGSQQNRSRLIPEDSNVFDLAVEVIQYDNAAGQPQVRRFYLYVNNIPAAAVEEVLKPAGQDYFPLAPRETAMGTTEVGLFVRGMATLQFEHIYAIGDEKQSYHNIYRGTTLAARAPEYLIYSPSTIWNTINLQGATSNTNYFDEFGTIAREVRKIEAKYEMYPSFAARVLKVPFNDRAYSISHFSSSPYGATMLLSSQSDSLISLTDVTAITISGLTFADNEEQKFTLDDYLIGNYEGASVDISYTTRKAERNKLVAQRAMKETSTVTVTSMYMQKTEYVKRFLEWVQGFSGKERLKMDIATFGTPHLQVGDIVGIAYKIPYIGNYETLFDVTTDLEEDYIPTPLEKRYGSEKIRSYAEAYNPRAREEEPYNEIVEYRRYIIRKITTSRSLTGLDCTLSLVELPNLKDWKPVTF